MLLEFEQGDRAGIRDMACDIFIPWPDVQDNNLSGFGTPEESSFVYPQEFLWFIEIISNNEIDFGQPGRRQFAEAPEKSTDFIISQPIENAQSVFTCLDQAS